VVDAPSVNLFKNSLDGHWCSQELFYDFELHRIGNRSFDWIEVLKVIYFKLRNHDAVIEAFAFYLLPLIHWLDLTCLESTFSYCQLWFIAVPYFRRFIWSVTCACQLRLAGCANLCTAYRGDLSAPPTKTKTFGSRSYCSAAPTVWNSLPHFLRQSDISRGQFASGLKRWLFSCTYT